MEKPELTKEQVVTYHDVLSALHADYEGELCDCDDETRCNIGQLIDFLTDYWVCLGEQNDVSK